MLRDTATQRMWALGQTANNERHAMISALRFRLRRLFSDIWFPISAYGLLGVLTAFAAIMLRDVIPEALVFQIGADAIDSLLNVLASSMLAVTTFSVSIMVTAFSGASDNATPRSVVLLRKDTTTQRVLASFIGAFIFSLVGIISLSIGVYGEGGRVILFVATIGVLLVIIFNLVRWIQHLASFGLIGDTLRRVEHAADDALKNRLEHPWLGARPILRDSSPDQAIPLKAGRVGYVEFVNLSSLNDLAEAADADIYIRALPGDFIYRDSTLAEIVKGPIGPAFDALLEDVRGCFDVGFDRDFDQDPRFGMITLSEIASRALSPAVNDPGTGIDVIRRITRVLSQWSAQPEPEITYPRLWIEALGAQDMMRDAFAAIARDGAALQEVQMTLQRALLALVKVEPRIFGRAAVDQSERALAFASDAMLNRSDVDRLAALSQEIAVQATILPKGSPISKI